MTIPVALLCNKVFRESELMCPMRAYQMGSDATFESESVLISMGFEMFNVSEGN